jgi:hypothetical protein
VAVAGKRFLRIRVSGMSIVDISGRIAWTGPTTLSPLLPSLQQVSLTDASEGVYVLVAGYDGPACPVMAVSPDRITITWPH